MKNYILSKTDRNKLIKAMKSARITQTELAVYLKQTRASINNKLLGRRGTSLNEYLAMVGYINERTEELARCKKITIKEAK